MTPKRGRESGNGKRETGIEREPDIVATGTLVVRINGEEQELPEGATVATVLERLGIATPRVAVERNREIVPKAEYAKTALAPGDALEVVEFVGGG